jgi:hypothetical protein
MIHSVTLAIVLSIVVYTPSEALKIEVYVVDVVRFGG